MLDFGALPPEINSGLMYTGPGAGPMLAAAAAWDGLATELGWAASSFAMVISGLTGGPWLGPTSMAMAAAAGPYVAWMTETAAQAEQASTQARAAAAAHEAAFAMTVPPPVIAGNRALLMALVATNFFGQNTPAIMATETQYMGMWAQDAAAMYGYAGASQTAARLTPFTPPPQTTNQTGAPEQGAAVAQATGTTSASQPATVNATNPALLTTSSSSSSTPLKGLVDELLNFWTTRPSGLDTLTGQQAVTKGFTELAYLGYGSSNSLVSAANTALSMQPPLPVAPAVPAPSANGLGAGLTGFEGLAGPGRVPAAVSASAGRATTVGALSAPPSWARAAPAMSSPAPPALPGNVTVSTGLAKGSMNAWGGMPPLGTARRGDGFFLPRYGMRITVVPEAPAVG